MAHRQIQPIGPRVHLQSASQLAKLGVSNVRHAKRRRGKALLIAIITLAVAGGGAYGYYRYTAESGVKDSNQPLLQSVVRGPFDHIVLEQGEVESSSNIDVNCEVKAKGTSGTPILWVIDEGTYVKKGDKLVELDASAFEDELTTQRIQVSGAESAVISSEALVRTAEISLQEYLEGTYLSERKTLLSEIALSEQNLRKAELNLASAERMAAKGLLKSLQIEAENFAVANTKNLLESAQAKLKVLDELTKQKMKVQYESDIEAARAKLGSDKIVLAEEQDTLKEIEQQIAKCLILSPADGVVVYNNSFSSRGGSEFVVEEGASVRERQTIIKLPDPTKMQVKAKINESRVTFVREGMPAIVKVGAAEGEMLARVTKVNKYAEPGSWMSSSVKEYAAFVEIKQPPETIRTGMTAEVRIFVEQLTNALQIPVNAIYEVKGHHFCLKRGGDGWETIEVKIGATNDKMLTILDGLVENDQIALNPRGHLDLMDLPEIEDLPEREQMTKMSAEVAATPKGGAGPVAGGGPGAGAGGAGGPAAGGPVGAGPAAGGAGAGGRGPGGGGFDPKAIADRIISSGDSDGDGKISQEEVAGMDDRMKERASSYDSNSDGFIEKSEIIKAMNKMMKAAGAGGPQGGGPR
jgi:HlyD family secretion protein